MFWINGIIGQQVHSGSTDYNEVACQYATSSVGKDHPMTPKLIIKPHNIEDIKVALKFAKENGIAVAVRTGGHQYSGASSTGPENIQLDLSETFREEPLVSNNTVKVGVSWKLVELNSQLGKRGLFVPHGQCSGVMLGGHVQTGGYGQLGRSFGLLGDCVKCLSIVTPDGKELYVNKTNHPDLFFGLLGGSPGNFGVVTHITLEALNDKNHRGARGQKSVHRYTPQKMKEATDILVQMADDDNYPRNYDLCISVVDDKFEPGTFGLEDCPDLLDEQGDTRAAILIYAQWVPISDSDKYDSDVEAWFGALGKGALPGDGVDTSPVERPMSEISTKWIFPGRREYELPYIKRTYLTNSTTLSKDGWSAWVTGRINKVLGTANDNIKLAIQLQYFGGKHSQFRANADNGTSYSWRKDTTIVAVLDAFHQRTQEAKDDAEAWQAINDKEGHDGLFSKQDRRVLWGSYGNWDLDAVWDRYYETREKYDRLSKIRKEADPYGTLTPNPFAVKRAE